MAQDKMVFLNKDHVTRKYEKMDQLIEEERKKKILTRTDRFHYQIQSSENDVPEQDFKAMKKIAQQLLDEDSIQALRWLKREFELVLAQRESAHSKSTFSDHFLKPKEDDCIRALKNPGFQNVLKYLQLPTFSEKGKNWKIPACMGLLELKSRKDDLIYFICYGIDFSFCKSCKNTFDNLRLHIQKQPKCLEKYPELDFQELNEGKHYLKRNAMRKRYQENCDVIAEKYQMKKEELSTKRKNLKDVIARKKAIYYQQNKDMLACKGYEYYAKNRDIIAKKRARYYEAKRDQIQEKRKSKIN